jgi:hypothetical protein
VIDNAFKGTPGGGQISVEARHEFEMLHIISATGIVRAHGGRTWVDSEGQDVERLSGNRFYVMLPMNASALREAALVKKH